MTEQQPQDDLLIRFETTQNQLRAARAQIGRQIMGQEEVITLTLVTLLSGGHGLLTGLPGLGKTLLVETVAKAMGLSNQRVQFTPDLMPSDILGSEILETARDGSRAFRYIEGPIFTQLLMADEINRASPRTQSALLQAMQERKVTVAGQAKKLPAPFHVLATQNPIEQEGTYPLPEAQLDRFLLQIEVPYPDRDTERSILLNTTGTTQSATEQALNSADLIAAQALVREMPVGDSVTEAILDLVRGCRPTEEDSLETVRQHIAWGPGPRAAQALMLAVRALALLEGRPAPTLSDLERLALSVLSHRMSLNFSARAEGVALHSVIEEVKQITLNKMRLAS